MVQISTNSVLDESKLVNTKSKVSISGTKRPAKQDLSMSNVDNGIEFECYKEEDAEKWANIINSIVNFK